MVVPISGITALSITKGIPEGGTIGTLAYTTLPDDLVRVLQPKGAGVGLRSETPAAWAGMRWHSGGHPILTMVEQLKADIANNTVLPPTELLYAWSDLQASALAAIDQLAPLRVVAFLHADDPVFLASSYGADGWNPGGAGLPACRLWFFFSGFRAFPISRPLSPACQPARVPSMYGAIQSIVHEISAWCDDHGAQFHVTRKKSVVVVHGVPKEDQVQYSQTPVAFRSSNTQVQEPLAYATEHKWLGVIWVASLHFGSAMEQRYHAATHVLSQLVGLVQQRAIPIHLAVSIFEVKVDAIMDHGRWLYVTGDNAKAHLDAMYATWAKALLGAPVWRNDGVSQLELGWRLTGYLRGVRAMVLRSARILLLPPGDLYRSVYECAREAPQSWHAKARAIMAVYNLPDFESAQKEGKSYAQYKTIITEQLYAHGTNELNSLAGAHRAVIPYNEFQVGPSAALKEINMLQLSWRTLLETRAWCRLRVGLLDLAHRGRCLFCGAGVRNPVVHVLGVCKRWVSFRVALGYDTTPDAFTKEVLGIQVGDLRFPALVQWLDEMDTCHPKSAKTLPAWRRSRLSGHPSMLETIARKCGIKVKYDNESHHGRDPGPQGIPPWRRPSLGGQQYRGSSGFLQASTVSASV